ncbi:MAG: hypothetical protein COB24_09855 [Hyphomicrobiales bacterium]|nr:MAG: hypothetical protein COB24_09855 [Hyphomicrobiales bacterium]
MSKQYSTYMLRFAKLQLTKHNAVRLGGVSASHQRLSGLARERSERTQCQAKMQTSRALTVRHPEITKPAELNP